MTKRITKSLRQAIVRAIHTGNEHHSSPMRPQEIVGYIKNDERLPISMRGKTTKQIAYIMNQLARDYDDVIVTEVLGRNGTNHHGNERFTKAFSIKQNITLADAEKSVGVTQKKKENKRQITVMLSKDSVNYIQAWKLHGMSAGQVVENLISADIEINGLPDTDRSA
tara:strand:+ start:2490 stop:2990 length:501 start_codon:yes stop_codon:yes gene_type:complete